MSRPSKQALPTILHCGSYADASGMQERCIHLIGALGRDAHHALAFEGAGNVRLPANVTRPSFPDLNGSLLPGRLKRLAQAMAGYDLLCTWGAGALDIALAHTLFADVYKLAPLVHHEAEDGGGRSTFVRRIALGRTAAVVVPTRAMEHVALERWQQPRHRVRFIPSGVDTAYFSIPPKSDVVPGLIKRRGELWLGTFGDRGLASRLIQEMSHWPQEWHLIITAEDQSHDAILAEASRHSVDDKVHPVRLSADNGRMVGLFDVFVAGNTSAGALEAMASGLPIVAYRESEPAALVASDNGPFLAAPDDEPALISAITRLIADRSLRRRIGEANRHKAREDFDQKEMVERMRALYRSLLGRN